MHFNSPELKTRIQSTFIDALLMVAMMIVAGNILDNMNSSQDEESGLIRGIIFVSIWGLYEPVSMSLGCTLGNYLMKIRVRRSQDISKKLNIFQGFARFVVKFFLGWLSFMTIHGNKERRAIHDFASGSVMIEK